MFVCLSCGSDVGGLVFVYNIIYVRVWVKLNCKIFFIVYYFGIFIFVVENDIYNLIICIVI